MAGKRWLIRPFPCHLFCPPHTGDFAFRKPDGIHKAMHRYAKTKKQRGEPHGHPRCVIIKDFY